LQLGGALGNLLTRVRIGHVTDFLDFGPWPVSNVADISIVTGTILLGILMIFQNDEEAAETAPTADQDGEEPVEAGEDSPVIWNE
ncbi:MAG: signal peptidase II, partial [Candidatus Promineifilaceae bacterium]